MRPDGPVAIMGDFNADLQMLPHCQQLVLHEDWCDVGAVASRWGGIDNQPTCLGHNALAPTRNDYLLVNAMALPLISDFRVIPTTDFDVHSILEVKFLPPARCPTLDINLVPASAHDALVRKFIVDHPHLDAALPIQSHQKEYKAFILGLHQQLGAALDILLPDFVELLACNNSDGAWILGPCHRGWICRFFTLIGQRLVQISWQGLCPPQAPISPQCSLHCYRSRWLQGPILPFEGCFTSSCNFTQS